MKTAAFALALSTPPPTVAPRASRDDNHTVTATCPWLALPGPPQAIPRHPYLNRRCGPGAGGPCSRRTTGRSGSGRGDLGPRVASAGQERPGREPRARGPDPPLPPPPGRLAGPGTSQGSHRLPPSALGAGRERAQAGWGRRRGLSSPLRPRVEPPAGWQGGEAAASSGAQRGRRKNTEKFAQEGAAYSRLSLPPVTDTGPPKPAALSAREPARLLHPQARPLHRKAGVCSRWPSKALPARSQRSEV